MPCIKSLLKESTSLLEISSDSASLDAEILLCQILKKERSFLRAWPDLELQSKQTNQFWSLIKQRQQGTPIAYITGNKEFWSRDFHVSPDVLIPRPDTELIIELSLKLILDNKPIKIIDLGTGSGIIAITLAAERLQADISATDLCLAALSIAKLNARKHDINNIKFYQSNWFANVPPIKFNLIITNPPYIAEDDVHLTQGDIRFEPRSALCSGKQGLNDIIIIADTARNFLEPGGHLLIEHGYDQQHSVQSILKGYHYDFVQTATDLSGQPRVTYGQWNKL
jgi:release factor glutamine methyltransferase